MLAERKAAYVELVSEFQIKKIENQRYLTEISSIEAEKANLELRLKNTVPLDDYIKLQAKFTELESCTSRLTFSLSTIEKQKSACEDTIFELEAELEKKRKDVQYQATTIQKYEINTRLSNATNASDSLAAAKSISDATEMTRSVTANLSGIQSTEIMAEAGDAESRYQALKKINIEFMEHIKTAQQIIIKKTEDLKVLRNEKSIIEREKEDAERKLQDLHEKNDSTQGENKYYERKFLEQREEVNALREDKLLLTANKTYLQIELDKYKSMLQEKGSTSTKP